VCSGVHRKCSSTDKVSKMPRCGIAASVIGCGQSAAEEAEWDSRLYLAIKMNYLKSKTLKQQIMIRSCGRINGNCWNTAARCNLTRRRVKPRFITLTELN